MLLALGGGLLLIAVAVLLGTQGSSTVSSPETAHEEETYPEVARVSLEEAKNALDAGIAIIVDVRAAEAYQAAHVAGSINIPLAELETRLGELDRNEWIITYCT
jgi:3-mercaptopyruvate sulfurtransferase SseA